MPPAGLARSCAGGLCPHLLPPRARRHGTRGVPAQKYARRPGAAAAHRLDPIPADRYLLTEAAETGDLRDDVAPEELASYCLHTLTAASSLPSKAAVRRLVTATLAGLRPPR